MSLEAGVSKVCITPPIGLPLGGTFIRPYAEAVHDDLWVRCLFLQNGDSRVALVTCDLLGLPFEMIDEVYQLVATRIGLKPHELIINCTHNHSGPDTAPIIHEPIDHPYVGELIQNIARAVEEAASAAVPAEAGYASTSLTNVCTNRRIKVKGGKVRMNWEPIPEEEIEGHGPIDPYLGVIRIDSIVGSPIAAVMHYTCHAAVVSPAPKQYSSDYPGYACRMVERLFGYGITAMFVNGAFGNINHIMKPTQFNAMAFGTAADRPFEEAERVGQSIAAKALELLPKIETKDVEVGSLAESLRLELRQPPTGSLEEAQAEVKRQKDRLEDAQRRGDEDEAAEAQISYTYAVHWANYYRNGITEAELRLAAIRIGDLGISCISGEPFVEIGFNIKGQSPFKDSCNIKGQSPFKDSWVLGNTCGYSGYLPTEEAFAEGGYEVRTCGWSKWKTDADKTVVAKSVELLRDLSEGH